MCEVEEDQGEEEREAAQVHVALGVEFAGLDFHAFGACDGAVEGEEVRWRGRGGRVGMLITYAAAPPWFLLMDSSICTR